MKCRVFTDRIFPIVSIVVTIFFSMLACSSATAEAGIASVYAYSGGKTASGERANPGGLTAAHRTLKFGTQVRVTNRVMGATSSCASMTVVHSCVGA